MGTLVYCKEGKMVERTWKKIAEVTEDSKSKLFSGANKKYEIIKQRISF